jgi:dinuclear metal center YbgI/SA1388 family protein
MSATIADVLGAVGEACPWEWAEPWDNCGLVVGDPSAEVTGVLVSLDADLPTITRAAQAGASLLVTHHPPFLEVPEQVTPSSAPALFAALRDNVAIISAHTNLDRAPHAAGVLLRRLGLGEGEPLEKNPESDELIAVYAPVEAAEDVRSALAASGAGRIALYQACSFSATGEGRFVPDADSSPHTGQPGQPSEAVEVRIEAVCAPDRFAAVSRAVVDAHPYEEPLVISTPIRRTRGSVALGRVAETSPTSLADLVRQVAEEFDCTPRVWGDPDSEITRVATGTGSSGSLVGPAATAGAHVLFAGEVRYHDALDAVARGVAVIEAGHDVTEWPLVPILAEAVSATPRLDQGLLTVEPASRGWWTP